MLENDHAIGNIASLMHIVKGNIGIGLLGLPWGIMHAGLILGPILLFVIAVVSVHCMQLLVHSAKHLCRHEGVSRMDYAAVMECAVRLGPIIALRKHSGKAKFLVNIFLMITQLGFCCVYFVFIAQDLRQVVISYWTAAPGVRVWTAMVFLPVLFLSFIRHLKILAWFSIAANIAIVTSLAIIFVFITPNLPPAQSRSYVGNASSIAIFFGTAVFALESIGIILPVENKMKYPEKFSFILNLGMSFVIALYVSFATVGYLKFGHQTCASITLNLPVKNGLAEAAKILYSFSILLTFLIQFYVPMEILSNWIQNLSVQKVWKKVMDIAFRISLTALTCLLAIAIPNLGNYITLIGAFSTTMLALIFPPIIDIFAFYFPTGDEEPLINKSVDNVRNKRMPTWIIVKDIIIIIFGFIGFVAGTITAVKKIIVDLSKDVNAGICSGGITLLTNTTTSHTNYTIN